MSKSLIKRIIGLGGAFLALIFTLLIKVGTTVTDGKNTSEAVYKGYFEFIDLASESKMFGFTRAMMIIGFIVLVLCIAYFITIFILEILKKNKIVNNLELVTKIVEIVLVGSMFVVLIGGLAKESNDFISLTTNVSLFGAWWIIGLIFAICPIVSEYLIKE